jgi:two-component system nitrate/nitrite sensor histidine kinase NarQ
MSYKWIKRLILWIPTITIGLWEYARHTVLLPYISMNLGNLLAAVIIFIITITILRHLFARLEDVQEKLNEERSLKAALQEREKLAQELHDGISQSLFMLSVKLDQLEMAKDEEDRIEKVDKLREKVRYVYDDVRQAISNLRTDPEPSDMPWSQSLLMMMEEFKHDSGIELYLDWQLSEEPLTAKEKIELFACLREALVNVQKHAQASDVWVTGVSTADGFHCVVKDNGRGFTSDPFQVKGRFGLHMMKDRAASMGWVLDLTREEKYTIVNIRKGRKDVI